MEVKYLNMTQNKKNSLVVGIIVTYGDRYKFIREVVHSLITQSIGLIVIVDNNSTIESKSAIEQLQHRYPDVIEVIWNPENLGSSGGIKIGLEHVALLDGFVYIWLLDDDNVPRFHALEALLACVSPEDEGVVLHSVRGGLSDAGLRYWIKRFPPQSSFYEFDLLTYLGKLLDLLLIHVHPDPKSLNAIDYSVPYAPYGGLFFHRSWLKRVGLPNEQFFVYCDDTEYTYRMTCAGAKILYVQESLIDDIDAYWGRDIAYFSKFTHVINSKSWFRIYYTLRNHSYFDTYFWQGNSIRYKVNKTVYLTIVWLYATLTRRIARFMKILNAVREGEQKRLGKRNEVTGL